ncbi:MAG: hypothetical protein DRG50_06205 [Deltaproteobacteria bacterium]|nr:MAG: hypothetical protein DRG50_06205 [Deltaproteobacteria bacterium]
MFFIVPINLKRASDFHGHLCPDLVIGYRACELAEKILGRERMEKEGIVVVAYNSTSAIDAIQTLTGCTIGNRALQIIDWGKHRYLFIFETTGEGVEISFRNHDFLSSEEYNALEEKMNRYPSNPKESALYQRMIDERVKQLLSATNEDIFTYREVKMNPVKREVVTGLLRCEICGDMVLRSNTARTRGKTICYECFNKEVGMMENN